MKIESQDRRIDELLKGNIFMIPRFQREYSWEADHVSTFWSDLIDNFQEPYFIGAMVVYKTDRQTLAVVDGQQRLTTITILLCAIRDAFKNMGETDLADGLQAFIEQKDRSNKTVYVLRTETSFPYLQEEVLKSEPSDVQIEMRREEEAIARAFSIFGESIEAVVQKFMANKEQTPEDNQNDARTWLTALRDTVFDLNVIVVELDNEDDAYLIFETLNTRGKDLALADLLRNHFSRFLKPTSEVDQVKHKWAKVHDVIKSAPVQLDVDTFIVHSWQSRYDFVTKAKVFPKAKEAIVKKNAKAHLDRFVSDAAYWRSIFDTEFQWTKAEKEVARSLNALRIFKVVQPAPGILSLVRAYRDNIIKYRVLRNAMDNIEKFHFAFNAVTSSRSSGGISGMYSSLGRTVFAANDSNEVAKAISELTNKLREREVASTEFDAGFGQIIHTKTHSSQKALIQYILKRIALFEGQPYIGDTDDLTIEHLLPQSKVKTGTPEEVVGQIGNLILVDGETNGKLSDNDFSAKKKILLDRGYKLPKLLLDADEITPDLIAQNTMRLSLIARTNVWKV